MQEYRGFVVRGAHRRLNPALKDLFVASYRGHARFADSALPTAVHVLFSAELDANRVVNPNRGSDIPGSAQAALDVARAVGIFVVVATQIDLPTGNLDCLSNTILVPTNCGDPLPPNSCGLLVEAAQNNNISSPNDSGGLAFFEDAISCSYASLTASDPYAAWDSLENFENNRQGHIIGHGVGMRHIGTDEATCLMDIGVGLDAAFHPKPAELLAPVVSTFCTTHRGLVRLH
jgi:hypothetical protein